MRSKSATQSSPDVAPDSAVIATKGVKTSRDFAEMMSALMSDLISGKVSPQVGNAVCNSGGKLLKVMELTWRYGSGKGRDRVLRLL